MKTGSGLTQMDGEPLALLRLCSNLKAYLEGLREEPLNLPGPRDGELVLLGELVHTQDGDDILEGLVVLQDLLDATRDLVVLHADDVGVHDPGRGVEGIDGGVDAQLGNALSE